MNLFQYEKIIGLNERELAVYNFVSTHLKETIDMNVRELSEKVQVSTTTILRFCKKMGCGGYTELKYQLKQEAEKDTLSGVLMSNSVPAIQYLQKIKDDPDNQEKVNRAAQLCVNAKQILFLGCGTSGSLCEYGARFFSSAGAHAVYIKDPFYPSPRIEFQDMIVIALSVSGETKQMINLIDGYKRHKAKIISITNMDSCTVARMSDLNFSYYMPLVYLNEGSSIRNMTTQIPVCYLIETIAYKIYKLTCTRD